jgi:hypothetical protein
MEIRGSIAAPDHPAPTGREHLRPDLLEARLFLMLLEKIERLIHEEIPRPS